MSTSGCANAATGEAGLDDQRRLASCLAAAVGTDAQPRAGHVHGAHRQPPAGGARGGRHRHRRGRRAAGRGCGLRGRRRGPAHDRFAGQVRVRHRGPARPGGTTVPVTVSGVAKGVGMIHPNMATMLCFVLTDATASPALLESLLRPVVARTWDQVSVDGDQSTNDTVLLAASGASGALPLEAGSEACAAFARRPGVGGPLAGAPAGRRWRGRHDPHHVHGERRPGRRWTPGPWRVPSSAAASSRPPSTAQTPTGDASRGRPATPACPWRRSWRRLDCRSTEARARAGQAVELEPDRLRIEI